MSFWIASTGGTCHILENSQQRTSLCGTTVKDSVNIEIAEFTLLEGALISYGPVTCWACADCATIKRERELKLGDSL